MIVEEAEREGRRVGSGLGGTPTVDRVAPLTIFFPHGAQPADFLKSRLFVEYESPSLPLWQRSANLSTRKCTLNGEVVWEQRSAH